VVGLQDCVINVHARDYCDVCWQNTYRDEFILVIFVPYKKCIFLCDNEKLDSFYVIIILIMHRILKQQGRENSENYKCV
jgi:recombinational DNA repair protein RecR